MLNELESQTEALFDPNWNQEKISPEEKADENMDVSNNHTETIVQTISRENDDAEDVDYSEVNFELSVSENITEWQTCLVNETAPDFHSDHFPIAIGD